MKNILLITIAALTIISCGEKGDPGVQGPPGNANVHSFHFAVTPAQWQSLGTVGIDYEKFINFSLSTITQDVLNNGIVLIYRTDGVPPTYNDQLPISFPQGTTTANMYALSGVGVATVEYQLGNFQVPIFTSTYYFKVSVIDGSVRLMHPEINWNDAKAISKGLNLN